MASKPDSKASDDKAEGTAKKKGGKGLIIGIVAAVLLAGGGGAAWFLTRPAAHGDEAEAKHAKPAADAIFMTLDPFTVNLSDEGGERLAQVAVTLELNDSDAQTRLTKNLPVVRNSLLLLISSQTTRTLLTLDGKQALADEIRIRAGVAMGWKPAEAEEEEEEAPVKAKKVSSKKVAARKPPPPKETPNPVVAVHFAQLLVQ